MGRFCNESQLLFCLPKIISQISFNRPAHFFCRIGVAGFLLLTGIAEYQKGSRENKCRQMQRIPHLLAVFHHITNIAGTNP